ncbi:MAG: phosphate uptake regulator PhoU [Desulfurococcaceae archaeon]
MERRKVQKTGSASYMITIPKTWVELLGLKSGDYVYIHRYEDKLIITPIKEEYPAITGEIRVSGDVDNKQIFRALVAMYLAGYDNIKITYNPSLSGLGKRISELKNYARIKLAGVEVIDETHNSLTIKILIDYRELTLASAIRRLHLIVNSMLQDAIQAFGNRDLDLAEAVIQRDDEADRFHFLIIRQLARILQDIKLMKELGISSPVETLNYRIVARNLERIADHAVNIAKRTYRLSEKCVFCKETCSLAMEINDVFNKSMESFYKLSRVEAEEALSKSEKLLSEIESLLFNKIIPGDVGVEEKIVLTMIMDSLRRISRYSSGIAEVSLNIKGIKSREYELK